jgi:hypothetical protein
MPFALARSAIAEPTSLAPSTLPEPLKSFSSELAVDELDVNVFEAAEDRKPGALSRADDLAAKAIVPNGA